MAVDDKDGKTVCWAFQMREDGRFQKTGGGAVWRGRRN